MHESNRYYGHDTILSSYCGFSRPRSIFGVVQHGWTPFEWLDAQRPGLSRLPFFVWSDRVRAETARARGSRVAAIGAPFAYLVVGLDPVRSKGGDVLVVPYHGLRNGAERGAADGLVERAAEREGADRIVVYLHYNEFQDAKIRAKIDRLGVRTQTFWPHGKRSLYDSAMLSRQITRFLSASKVVSNTVCTPLWYAAYLGVVPEVYGPEPLGSFDSVLARWSREGRIRWPHMYVDSADYDSQASLDASQRELGGDLLLSPSELSEVLGFTSPACRLGAISIDRIALMRRRLRTVMSKRRARACQSRF